jgi:uncharacterized protein (DUF1697 family)
VLERDSVRGHNGAGRCARLGVNTWVALLRGINVTGRNLVPMKALMAGLEREGFSEIRTYIQSGNAVFASRVVSARTLERRIGRRILEEHGFEPRVMVLTPAQLRRAAKRNPFPGATDRPATLHVFFLASAPKTVDHAMLERLRTGEEAYALDGRIAYLLTPDGYGPSKLASRFEHCLGVGATARNWRTVTRLIAMSREDA